METSTNTHPVHIFKRDDRPHFDDLAFTQAIAKQLSLRVKELERQLESYKRENEKLKYSLDNQLTISPEEKLEVHKLIAASDVSRGFFFSRKKVKLLKDSNALLIAELLKLQGKPDTDLMDTNEMKEGMDTI